MDTNLIQFCQQFQTVEQALKYLRDRRILRQRPPRCSRENCVRLMTEVKSNNLQDQYVWRCPSHKGCKKSVRDGSILENSNLALSQFVLLSYTWAFSIASKTQQVFCGVSERTVVDWNHFFRNVCSRSLVQKPLRLGGPGHIVEIDDSLMARRTCKKSRVVPEKCIFGLYDVSEKKGVVEFVADTSKKTVLPIIEKYALPGSIIHSDSKRPYIGGTITSIPVTPSYEHYLVKHNEKVVDSVNAPCTKHVKSFWKSAKVMYKRMNGTTAEMLPSYLDEYVWRQQYGNKGTDCYNNILAQIAIFFPVEINFQ